MGIEKKCAAQNKISLSSLKRNLTHLKISQVPLNSKNDFDFWLSKALIIKLCLVVSHILPQFIMSKVR